MTESAFFAGERCSNHRIKIGKLANVRRRRQGLTIYRRRAGCGIFLAATQIIEQRRIQKAELAKDIATIACTPDTIGDDGDQTARERVVGRIAKFGDKRTAEHDAGAGMTPAHGGDGQGFEPVHARLVDFTGAFKIGDRWQAERR